MNFKNINFINKILSFFLYIIFFFLAFLPFWFKKKFGVVYLDQFIFHLEILFKGKLVGDAQVQKSLLKWSFATSTISTLIYLYFKKSNLNKFKITIKKEIIFFFIIIFLSLSYNTGLFRNLKIQENDFIDKNYVFTKPLHIKNNKRNLVIIYVESLDKSFSIKKNFGRDLLQPLSKEVLGGQSIENFYQIPGYAFTINSLVSTQCGIPAKPLGFFSNSELKNIKNFLPNIKCLSDFTHDLNYQNIFFSSDELENFGIKYYLMNHNFKEENIYGLKKLDKLGYSTSKNAWRGNKIHSGGIHDDVLFSAALDVIRKKVNDKKPFFLSLYTLDTHSPRGYPNHECLVSQFDDINIVYNFTIRHSVICTVESLKNFIIEIKNLSDQTDIVILGDHLFPTSNEEEISIYNSFILDEKKFFNRSKMNHFDFFPSILHLLGYEFEENRLGLGFSVFNYIDLDFYNTFISNLDKKISGKSKKYLSFWDDN